MLTCLTSSYVWPNQAQHTEQGNSQPTVTVSAPGMEGMAAAQATPKDVGLTKDKSAEQT